VQLENDAEGRRNNSSRGNLGGLGGQVLWSIPKRCKNKKTAYKKTTHPKKNKKKTTKEIKKKKKEKKKKNPQKKKRCAWAIEGDRIEFGQGKKSWGVN